MWKFTVVECVTSFHLFPTIEAATGTYVTNIFRHCVHVDSSVPS